MVDDYSENRLKYYMENCSDKSLVSNLNIEQGIKEGYNTDFLKYEVYIDIENYDIILCMTMQHKRNVLELFPKLFGKVFTLKEYVNSNEVYKDIDDPWGLNLQVYKDCAKVIVENIDKLILKLEEGE